MVEQALNLDILQLNLRVKPEIPIERLEPRSTKDVAVFRTMGEALTFLGIEGKLEPWPAAKADASK